MAAPAAACTHVLVMPLLRTAARRAPAEGAITRHAVFGQALLARACRHVKALRMRLQRCL